MTEITEGNKLIAEFMGFHMCEKDQRDPYDMYVTYFPYDHKSAAMPFYYVLKETALSKRRGVAKSEIKFHTSWDWLMPVVEKIESLGFKFEICRKKVTLYHDDKKAQQLGVIKHNNKIESVWNAVLQFINYRSANQ